jgi:mRNA interferase RelE/StbE
VNGAATQIASRQFDVDFFRLPRQLQQRVQARIDWVGTRLTTFPHFRMTGSERYRLRIGDYRVIYRFDLTKQVIYLLAIGHRREVYRSQT